MSPSGTIMSYISPMQEKPALRPSVAVGEALRGVARDILAEARAAIEDADDHAMLRRAGSSAARTATVNPSAP